MWYHNLGYFIQEAVTTLHREHRLYVIAMVVISIALMLLGLFMLAVWNGRLLLQELGEQFQVVVFLTDSIQPEQRHVIAAQLHTFAGAEALIYISKEQAQQQLATWLPEGRELLAGLTENPLPASYVVPLSAQTHETQAVQELVQRLRRLPGVEEVTYSAQWYHRFRSLLYAGQILSLIGGLLFSLGIVFIVANTIRLTVYMRLHEIEIMHLVGATDRFIKSPFLISGMLQGLLGSVLAIGLLFGLYRLLVQSLGDLWPMVLGQVVFLPWSALGGLVVGGVVLGYIGSAWALSRVLRALETGS